MESKKLFQSILKIDVTYGKYARLSARSRRGEDTQAISESSLPSQEDNLFLKQNQNTEENRLQYTHRQWDCCNIARLDTKTHGTHVLWGMDVWNCLCSAEALPSAPMSMETPSKSRAFLQSSLSVFKLVRNKWLWKQWGFSKNPVSLFFFRSFILRGHDFQCHQCHYTQPYLVTSQWTRRNKQEDKIAH